MIKNETDMVNALFANFDPKNHIREIEVTDFTDSSNIKTYIKKECDPSMLEYNKKQYDFSKTTIVDQEYVDSFIKNIDSLPLYSKEKVINYLMTYHNMLSNIGVEKYKNQVLKYVDMIKQFKDSIKYRFVVDASFLKFVIKLFTNPYIQAKKGLKFEFREYCDFINETKSNYIDKAINRVNNECDIINIHIAGSDTPCTNSSITCRPEYLFDTIIYSPDKLSYYTVKNHTKEEKDMENKEVEKISILLGDRHFVKVDGEKEIDIDPKDLKDGDIFKIYAGKLQFGSLMESLLCNWGGKTVFKCSAEGVINDADDNSRIICTIVK